MIIVLNMQQKNASAVIIWNDGTTPSRVDPFFADISGSGLNIPCKKKKFLFIKSSKKKKKNFLLIFFHLEKFFRSLFTRDNFWMKWRERIPPLLLSVYKQLPELSLILLLMLLLKPLGEIQIGAKKKKISFWIVEFFVNFLIFFFLSFQIIFFSVILVGSHLDSVPAGPGINDNGR
jgi:hypothetical protein